MINGKLLLTGTYSWLLISLLLFLLVAPIVQQLSVFNILVPIFFVTILLSGLCALIHNRRFLRIAVALVLITIISRSVSYFVLDLYIFILGQCFGLIFLVLIAMVIFASVFRQKDVSYDTIAGSICVYLLIGLVWGVLYNLVGLIAPGSFAVRGEAMETLSLERIRVGGFPEFFYFSFVTLTTLGYGDITPASPLVRSLATLEALVGPLYLTILVARLVGLHMTATNK